MYNMQLNRYLFFISIMHSFIEVFDIVLVAEQIPAEMQRFFSVIDEGINY